MEQASESQPQKDIKLRELEWLYEKGYFTDELYNNAKRYYKDENIDKLQNKSFENWVYDEYCQKTIIDKHFFDGMTLKDSNKIIAIFGELYSGREYAIKHLYNAGRILDRKMSYIKESLRGILCKKLSEFTKTKKTINETVIGMMVRCFPLNEYYADEAQKCDKLKKERFINQFIADNANVIIYINNDEDDEQDENLQKFKEKYNIDNKKEIIVIKNGFKKENIQSIQNEEQHNKFRIYYENEDENIETFKRIFLKIKSIKAGTTQDIMVRYHDYFTINHSFLNDDWIKCEYPELLNSNLTYSVKQENNDIIVTLECFEEISDVTYNSTIWNNSLYLIITAKSITNSTINLYILIPKKTQQLNKIKFEQHKENGLVTITLS